MTKFNFNIDIEDNERQNSLSKFVNISKSQKQAYVDQYIVDLGLPSGTKWCKYNLGFDINQLDKTEDWYGDYYAWGELKPKDQYTQENYKFGKVPHIKKYNKKDNLKQLQLENDAAYQNIHINDLKFKIPSKKQFEELIENTTSEWVENYNDINRLNGKIFKSKTNNNEMFIPAAGFYYDSELCSVGIIAYLWSSSLYADYPDHAQHFYFGFRHTIMYHYNRCYGMSIRPVLLKS